MSKDDIYEQRDKLWAEIHKGVMETQERQGEIYKSVITTEAVVHNLKERIEEAKNDLKSHEVEDKKFQDWIIKIGIIVLIIVVANGGISAIKTIFHVG